MLARVRAPHAPHAWGERELRRMLRDLRRPHRLATEPLAQFLCEIYELDSPYEACVRLIRDTFVNAGLVGKKLYSLIHTCDIDASSTLLAAASDMGLSARQFFRYRHEAIVALAAHVNQLGGERPRETTAVEQLAHLLAEFDPSAAEGVYGLASSRAAQSGLARLDAALGMGHFFDDAALANFGEHDRRVALLRIARTALFFGNARAADAIVDDMRASLFGSVIDNRELIEYEMLSASYVRALHRGSVDACVQLARDMRRAGENDDARTLYAMLIEAEGAVRGGDLNSAEAIAEAAERAVVPRKQLRLVAIVVVLRSAIAFMRGDLEGAWLHIHSAKLALADRPFDAMTIHAFIGRLSLASGMAWRAPHELLEAPETQACVITPSSDCRAVSIETSRRLVFPRLYLKAVDLRAAFLVGELETVDEITELLALAKEAGYPVIQALASILNAHWAHREGDSDTAQRCTVDAWEIAATIGDFYMGRDLFWPGDDLGRECGAVDLDRAFFDAFYRAMAQRFPMVNLVSTASEERNALWRSLILKALHSERPRLAFSEHLPKPRGRFAREVACSLSILISQEKRDDFVANLSYALETLSERAARHKSVT